VCSPIEQIIRTPKLAVPSYYRLCTGEKSNVTGFEYCTSSSRLVSPVLNARSRSRGSRPARIPVRRCDLLSGAC
jgi:hypothetical protein